MPKVKSTSNNKKKSGSSAKEDLENINGLIKQVIQLCCCLSTLNMSYYSYFKIESFYIGKVFR